MATLQGYLTTISLVLIITNFVVVNSSELDDERLTLVKKTGFVDPKSGYRYQVFSHNVTSMTTDLRYRSLIRVSRIHINEKNQPYGEIEKIQTITFTAQLVDFDLHCQPTHCYLVAVTSKTTKNVELYNWQRTQFDVLAKRDSFARPHAVKLFNINSAFYIAIAQDQLHLRTLRSAQEYEETTRFIGCAILKFFKGQESSIKYHQFIRLPFDPLYLQHYISHTYAGLSNASRPTENHYLVFSFDQNWHEPGSAQAYSFIWSSLNDYFWPFRIPSEVTIVPPSAPTTPNQPDVPHPPIARYPILKFPGHQFETMNITQLSQQEQYEPIEACFNYLQQVLANRESHSRKLIDSSRSIWQSPAADIQPRWQQSRGSTNVTAQVFVKGSVIVRGSLIESPQITMVSNLAPNIITVNQISALANDHSPAIVENRLKQAAYRLRYIRDKLSKAVFMTVPGQYRTQVSSKINFFGTIQARQTFFVGSGISNSDVKLNGIPFKQLEHELVSLRGPQEIASKVIFTGNVVADLLEIHGILNGEYFLKDAVDITSRQVQILTGKPNRFRGMSMYRFQSVSSPEIVLSYNSTLNGIRLDDFITTSPQPQTVHGRKIFKQLSMARLDIGNPHVLLNGVNISRLATSAVFLQNPSGKPYQFIDGHHQTFLREVSATRLTLNNVVNQHINMSSLIQDSVKTDDSRQQQISGFKRFQQGIRISRLTTEGAINDILMDRVFILNSPANETSENSNLTATTITGRLEFGGPVSVVGSMKVGLINGVNIDQRAVKRVPASDTRAARPPQMIRGRKIFLRPLRITERVGLLASQILNDTRADYPLINNLDIRSINPGIARQMQNRALITIDELEIDGNLNLPTSANGVPRTTLGNYSVCPLDVIRSKLVSTGPETQFIDVTSRIGSLRARSVYLEPKALNGYSFPADFVLRSTGDLSEVILNQPVPTEFLFGHKIFRHISIVPPLPLISGVNYNRGQFDDGRSVLVGPLAKINNITHSEIQAFVDLERRRNSTGETVLQTLNVHGNIFAKRINGNSWPDDILLKSIGSDLARNLSPHYHKRIYSPLVFINHSSLIVENQLVLRGPIHLRGHLNGVNLTEFARKSVTYGDKDLLSTGRPLSNKVFAGGLTVTSEVRAHGLIDGVNFDDMKRKVVLIGPSGKTIHMIAPKVFMSDLNFMGPFQVVYLNNLSVDHYLKRARYDPVENLIKIYGKKTVSGALVVNQNLVVQGLINNIDFIELGQKAISVRPGGDNLQFNRTMTIEGNAYMDNLYVDENSGSIDGVKLADLKQISQTPSPVRIPKNYPFRQLHYKGNATYMRTTPPYATTTSYQTSRSRGFENQLHINPNLSRRPPMSIRYELPRPVSQVLPPFRSPFVVHQLERLRDLFITSNIIQYSPPDDKQLIIGFIDAPSRDIANLQLPDYDPPHAGSYSAPLSFIQLDQVDFPYAKHINYHCRVGLSKNYNSPNSTQVICSVGGTDVSHLATLPVGSPNNAIFLKEANGRALFLLISEDTTSRTNERQCAPPASIPAARYDLDTYRKDHQHASLAVLGSVHIYLFHVLQNSSSLSSAFFDLYQTIDLPAIDSFEGFKYQGSTYALAVSRASETVYLLLLRGYSGFQVVSTIHAPGIEYVRVVYSVDYKPSLIMHQTSGLHRLMESVMI